MAIALLVADFENDPLPLQRVALGAKAINVVWRMRSVAFRERVRSEMVFALGEIPVGSASRLSVS
jgi:hypothetical protein